MLLSDLAECLEQKRTLLRGVGHEAGFDELKRRDSGRTANRVATVGATLCAGFPVHHVFPGDDRAERHTTCESLGHQDDVGHDVVMVEREPFPRPSGAGLNLVADQQNPVLAAHGAQVRHEIRRRDHVATFTLQSLNKDSGDFRRFHLVLEQLRFDGVDVAIGYVGDHGDQRAKVLLLSRFGTR